VLLELQTAKKIIELLHEETNSTVQHNFTNSQSRNPSSILSAIHSDFKQNAMDMWNTANYTRQKHIKQPAVHQQQPILMIVNCYMLPIFTMRTQKTPSLQAWLRKKKSVKPKNNFISKS